MSASCTCSVYLIYINIYVTHEWRPQKIWFNELPIKAGSTRLSSSFVINLTPHVMAHSEIMLLHESFVETYYKQTWTQILPLLTNGAA